MLAEPHLAEDAVALHLLLQHLESLVDIVVADENLHAVFLFYPTVDAQFQGAWATGRTDMGKRCRAYTASGRLQGAKNCARQKNYSQIAVRERWQLLFTKLPTLSSHASDLNGAF